MIETQDSIPWLFVLGDHDVGKSYMIKGFQKEDINSSYPTFGYQLSNIQQEKGSYVHVIQFTDVSDDNVIFKDLYQKHYFHAAILILFDIREPSKIQGTIQKFLGPILKIQLSGAPKLRTYYEVASSDGPVSLPATVMTTETVAPVFFVASFTDKIPQDELIYQGYMKFLRNPALIYAAGTATTRSPSLLSLCTSFAIRKPISENLRSNIGNVKDFFIPPGWDTPEKLSEIDTPSVQENNLSKEEKETALAEDWETFLGRLSKIPRDSTSKTQSTPAQPSKTQENDDVDDYFQQFEN